MTRYGMLINTLDCIGCYTCRVSCQRQNGLVPTEAFIHFLDSESGTYPHVKTEVVPVQCSALRRRALREGVPHERNVRYR